MKEKPVLFTSKLAQLALPFGLCSFKQNFIVPLVTKKKQGIKEKTKNKKPINILRVGDFCELKITALGPLGVGIDEFSYGYPILIPNAKLGEIVKAQIKMFYPLKKSEATAFKDKAAASQGVEKQNAFDFQRFLSFTFKKAKYAVAQVSSVLTPTPQNLDTKGAHPPTSSGSFKVGEVLTVKLNSIVIQTDNSYIGIVNSDLNVSKKFQIIIPQIPNEVAQVGQEIQIQVTRIKIHYCFAKMVAKSSEVKLAPESLSIQPLTYGSPFNTPSLPKITRGLNENRKDIQLTKGTKITLTLPKTAKQYAKHLVILLSLTSSNNTLQKEKPYVLFVKNLLGAKFGEKVRVKFTKIGSTFAIGKIVRIAPNTSLKKLARARKNINEMLANGMHYGEKVVKCQARMRSFIWNRQKGQKKFATSLSLGVNQKRSLVGYKKGDKNSPLVKKGRHLINLLKTRRCLNIGLNQLTKYAAKGRTFLFVGTKKPAAGLIARAALFSKTSFFVNTRWLGGMLTNWKTIIKSISKIRPILKEKQKVITNILQKRAKIQNRLIKKVLSLRKKSKILIKKGKQLIDKVQTFAFSGLDGSLEGATRKTSESGANKSFPVFYGINIKRKELFERGQFLLQKRQSLLNKQNLLKDKTLNIKESGFLIANKYKVLFSKLTATHKKLHDLRLLFILNKELRNIAKLAKERGKTQYTLSYVKAQALKQLPTVASGKDQQEKIPVAKISSKKLWLIPNPPQEILNKILITIKASPSNLDSQKNSSSAKQTILVAPKGGQMRKGPSEAKSEGSLQFDLNIFAKGPSLKPFNSRMTSNFSIKEKNNSSLLPFENEAKGLKMKQDFNQSIILTKLLSKFSRFLPYIKNAISSLLRIMLSMEKKMAELKSNLKLLKKKLIDFLLFNNKINAELKLIQTKYTSEQQIIRVLRRKLKRHEAEKKLLQFLPKLRYLPTPKSQISLAIQILMKRFVDPKLKYPMDLIYDEKLRKKSKKVAAARKKKWQRLETYFGGIANMTKLKKTQISNNVAIIIGQQEEMNAVRECKKLGIKMFHIVDTNCNPSLADHFIPSNDDSRNSIKYLLTKIVTRIRLAQKIRLLKIFKKKQKANL